MTDSLVVPDTVVSSEITVSEAETWSMTLGMPYHVLIRVLRGELLVTNVYQGILADVIPEEILKELLECPGHEPEMVDAKGKRTSVSAGDISVGDAVELIDKGFARVTDLSETNARITVYSGEQIVYYGPKHVELSILPKGY